MKRLITYTALAFLLSINYNSIAQVYQNCIVTFYAVGKDSISITATSKEATIELNSTTGEFILKVKIRSFTTENIGLAKELKEYDEKLIFRGLLGIDPIKNYANQNSEIMNSINGNTKINGIRIPTIAQYNIFQKSNSAGNNQPPLLNLEFIVLLSDFNISEYFPELMNEVKISLARQPLNVLIEH